MNPLSLLVLRNYLHHSCNLSVKLPLPLSFEIAETGGLDFSTVLLFSRRLPLQVSIHIFKKADHDLPDH